MQLVFAIACAVVAILVLYLVQGVMGAFVLGAIFAFIVNPVVNRIAAAGIPRALAIAAVFAVVIALFGVLVTLLAPLLTSEIAALQYQVPNIAIAAQRSLTAIQGRPMELGGLRVDLTGTVDSINKHASDFLLGQFGNAVNLGITAVTTTLQVVLMLIVAFLLALDGNRAARLTKSLVPTDYRDDFDAVWGEIRKMLYSYMRGQLIIAALIGVASGVAAEVMHLPYALALGLLAGVTSLVPYLGPFLGALPAVLIGLADSPEKALLVAVVYAAISNIILNFVFPKVMGDAVRLPPIFVIVAFIAGFSLAGILGMFVAIPVAATLRILFDHVHARLYGPDLDLAAAESP